MKRTFMHIFLISLFIILTYLPVLIFGPEQVQFLIKGDGVFETCSAISYFFSACLMFYLFHKSKSNKETYFLGIKRNLFLLLLGLLFLAFFGEEISWGQRIFGIKTPAWLGEINSQNEINIHNLRFFYGLDENGSRKTGLSLWYNLDRIYTLCWLIFCVLIPVLNRYLVKIQTFLSKISFPVVMLWIAPLFLINYLIAKFIEISNLFDASIPIAETKENNFALLYLLVSVSFYSLYRNKKFQFV